MLGADRPRHRLALIDEFGERTEGKGEIGVLDAPSFLALLLGSVITSYQRAFDKIAIDLEEFDLEALRSARGDAETRIGALVDVRRQVGALRRSLVPHREVSSRSASASSILYRQNSQRKGSTSSPSRPTRRLAAALDAKNAITGSFHVVIARTEHRTNEIMKVLALASILLLPGRPHRWSDGNERQLSAHVFEGSVLFWVVLAVIALLAGGTPGAARTKHWI